MLIKDKINNKKLNHSHDNNNNANNTICIVSFCSVVYTKNWNNNNNNNQKKKQHHHQYFAKNKTFSSNTFQHAAPHQLLPLHPPSLPLTALDKSTMKWANHEQRTSLLTHIIQPCCMTMGQKHYTTRERERGPRWMRLHSVLFLDESFFPIIVSPVLPLHTGTQTAIKEQYSD